MELYDVLYCAFRLGMPWRRYLEEHDSLAHLVWWEWFLLHEFQDMGIRKKDPYECIVGDGPDAHVSKKTWERWAGKVASAGYRMLAQDKILKEFAKQGDQEAINRLKAKGVKIDAGT